MSIDFAPHSMTGADTPTPYVASASTEFSAGFAAYKAFNGISTFWAAANATITGWLKLDTGPGNRWLLATYDVKGSTAARSPKNWTMEGSNDNSTWDVLDTVTGETGWADHETRSFTCDVATTGYRYFRLNVTLIDGGDLVAVEEFYLFGTQTAGTPGSGAYLSRAGWTAYAENYSGDPDPTFAPDKAIDANDATMWKSGATMPSWWYVDMGSAQVFNFIQFEHEAGHWPHEIEIYVSSDGVNWGNPITAVSLPAIDGTLLKTIVFPTQNARWFKIFIRRHAAFFIGHVNYSWPNTELVEVYAGVAPDPAGELGVTAPGTWPEGIVGQAYTSGVNIRQGTGPYTAAISSGALPAGITLYDDGSVSGLPAEGGNFTFTILVTDAEGSTYETPDQTMYVFKPGEPGPGATITGMRLVVWFGFEWTDYNAPVYMYLGDVDHTPGSVFSGAGAFYLDGTAYDKTSVEYEMPVDGSGAIPVTGASADASAAIVWLSIGGPNGLPFGFGNDVLTAYGMYFLADYSDGSRMYSYPTTVTVEQYAGTALNENNVVDGSLNTFASITRVSFSGLGTGTFLRITGFGEFTTTPTVPTTTPKNYAY